MHNYAKKCKKVYNDVYVAADENVFAHVVGCVVVVVIISSRGLRLADIISLGASAVAKIRAEREPLSCPERRVG